MKNRPAPLNSRRGSVLIVALLLCAIIGISLVSYLQLGRTTLTVSNRAFYNNVAMNLCERGLEEGMYAINKNVANDSYTWPGWTSVSGDMKREWTSIDLESQGATASFRVYFYNYAIANPAPKTVISRSKVVLAGNSGKPIEKWVQITLKKTSLFANGLVAKEKIDFNGNNASVDSWNSDPDNNPSTTNISYSTSTSVRRANGSVASNKLVQVDNADIFGYVATGGDSPSVSSQGMITGNFSATGGTVDASRVDTNFNTSMEIQYPPSGAYSDFGGAITSPVSLPRKDIDTIKGTDEYADYYMISADSVNFNGPLTITDKVVLKLTNTTTAIDLGGSDGALNINPGAAFVAYGSGDFKISGKGIMNGTTDITTVNQPINCQFWGTKGTLAQNIDIVGNGVLSAIVYAPNGSVDLNGNTDVCGSIVANDITIVGNAKFHYDESLAYFNVDTPYRIYNWKELTTEADRNASTATVINW